MVSGVNFLNKTSSPGQQRFSMRLLLAGQPRPGRLPPAAAATAGLAELGADAQQALHQGGQRMVGGWLVKWWLNGG